MQFIPKINALLRSHYGINPEDLDNEDWAKLFAEYNYVKAIEYKNLNEIIEASATNALSKVLSDLFKN